MLAVSASDRLNHATGSRYDRRNGGRFSFVLIVVRRELTSEAFLVQKVDQNVWRAESHSADSAGALGLPRRKRNRRQTSITDDNSCGVQVSVRSET
jgi:hypothetical protein